MSARRGYQKSGLKDICKNSGLRQQNESIEGNCASLPDTIGKIQKFIVWTTRGEIVMVLK